MKRILFLLPMFLLVFFACDDDEGTIATDDSTNTGTVRLMFQHRANDINGGITDIALDSMAYLTTDNDTFELTSIKYYISNVKLITADDDTVSVPNSYYLFEQSTNQLSARIIKNISGVPTGTYTKVCFSIGVDAPLNNPDSVSNFVGDLSATNGMPWIWVKGFKFMKMEGFSNTNNGTIRKPLTFHIGENVNYKTVTQSTVITIQEGKTTMIHFMGMLHKLFSGSSTIDFDVNNDVQVNPAAVATEVANNYADMFMLHHTEVLE